MKERIKIVASKIKNAYDKALCRLKKFFGESEFYWIIALITIGALLLRYTLFDYASNDYNTFLFGWVNKIKELGLKKSLGTYIGDYSPAYYYILAFLARLPLSSLVSIKLVSIFFDVVAAWFVMLIVYEFTKNNAVSIISYAIALLLPTVILNGAMWAQCDSIYTSFCLASIYFLIKKKNLTALILYGVAFSFKLQAVFIGPIFAILYFKRKIPLYSPFIVLGVYFLTCIPPWICGRDLGELLMVYFYQAGEYTALTMNSPSAVVLLGNVVKKYVDMVSSGAIYFTFCVVAFVIYVASRFIKFDKTALIDFSMLFALIIPFLLPHMHERYFYVADVLSICYLFIHRKRAYTLILTQFCSLWVVCNYLFGMNYLTLQSVAVIQLVNVILLSKDIIKDYARNLKADIKTDALGATDGSNNQ